MVTGIRRYRQFSVGLSSPDRWILPLRPILGKELLGWWYLRHREADPAPVDDRQTGRCVVKAHDHVGSRRHEHTGVHRAVVFIGQSGQVAELVCALVHDHGAAGAAFLLGAAYFSSEKDPLCWATRRAITLPHDAVVIPRYFHPLVQVVRS